MQDLNLTQYLQSTDQRGLESYHRLFPLVYKELRKIAKSVRYKFGGIETLNTTAIIHEAYIKVADNHKEWESRSHFYSVAAKAMRQVLLNAARAKQTDKRGGQVVVEPIENLEDNIAISDDAALKLIDFEQLLLQLETKDALYGRIVECRFFAGMSIKETAAALNISPATVKRKWQLARDWLFVHLPQYNFS